MGSIEPKTVSQLSRLTKGGLAEIYSRSKRLTANVVFESGNVQLRKALFEEVRRCTLSKVQQTTKKLRRIKKRFCLLVKRAVAIRKAEKNYMKWKNVDLKDMIRYKKNPVNKWKIPTRKAEMQAKWLVVRNNRSPHVSPSNSDNEGSLEGDDESYNSELDADVADERLVFEDEEVEETEENEEDADEE